MAYIKKLLLNSWLTFAFFSSIISLIAIISGAEWLQWDMEAPYSLGREITQYLLPPVIAATFIKDGKKRIKYFWATVFLVELYLGFLSWKYWNTEGGGYLMAFLIVTACLQTGSYYFLKYLSPKKVVHIIVSILGLIYLTMYTFVLYLFPL